MPPQPSRSRCSSSTSMEFGKAERHGGKGLENELLKQNQEQDLVIGLHEWNDEVREAEGGTDPLTQLNTRAVFDRELKRALEFIRGEVPEHHRAAGERIQEVCVLFIDLDNFKEVNDSFGHLVGDEALKTVAKVLTHSVRDTDVVSRFGGDEFYILLPRINEKDAEAMGNKILESIGSNPILRQFNIGASIGVSSSRRSTDPVALVHLADLAALDAKGAGKNRVSVSTGGNEGDKL